MRETSAWHLLSSYISSRIWYAAEHADANIHIDSYDIVAACKPLDSDGDIPASYGPDDPPLSQKGMDVAAWDLGGSG